MFMAKLDVVQTAKEVLSDRRGSENDEVARALAGMMLDHDPYDDRAVDATNAGVAAAIEESDDATYEAAVDHVQAAVYGEVESRAKEVAMRMIRELAAAARAQEAAKAR